MRPFLLSSAFSFSLFVVICICSLVANLVLLVGQLAVMCPKPSGRGENVVFRNFLVCSDFF